MGGGHEGFIFWYTTNRNISWVSKSSGHPKIYEIPLTSQSLLYFFFNTVFY